MAEYKDRVKDQTNTTGTGTITVDGVAGSGGYRTIAAAHTNGATLRYTIINSTGSEWEVGEGVWTSATSTLTRATVYASSNAGSLVSFSSGAKVVFTGPAAQDMTDAIGPINTLAASGTIYLLGTTQSTATNGATARVAGGLSYNATNGTLSTPSGTVLDTNNYTTYTVSQTGTGASGTWGISITGSAAAMSVSDTRSDTTGPSIGRGVRFDFKTNNVDGLNDGGSYHGVMTFQQWDNSSGGGTRQLGFTDNNNIWIRGSGSGLSTYSAWKLLLDSTNFSSYALPLSGGTLTGNLTFSGTSRRITGDFSNATVASRTLFQTSTTDGQTLITAIPNGTATNSQFQAFNSSDPANSSIASLVAASGTVRLVSGNIGTGTLLPIAFVMSATEVARFDTSGNLGIGTTSPSRKLTVASETTGLPTLGTAAGGAFFASTNGLYGLYAGVNGATGDAWLQAMRNDSAIAYNIVLNPAGGRVGLGGTPKAWSATQSVIELFPSNGAGYINMNATSVFGGYLYWNMYFNGTSNICINTGVVGAAGMNGSGGHDWYVGTGTAGATPTLTLAKSINASGTHIGYDLPLTRYMLKDTGFTYYNSGTTSSLDYTNGSCQRFAPNAATSYTVSISNWPPSGNLGELLLMGVNLGAATITWPTINWLKTDGTTTTTFSSSGVTLATSGTDWILIWTTDAGTTLYGKVVR